MVKLLIDKKAESNIFARGSIVESLTLSSLSKIFSGQLFRKYFTYCSQKTGVGNNFHEMSDPVFWGKYEKISQVCRLLN